MLKAFSPLPYVTEQGELVAGAIYEPNGMCVTCVTRECGRRGYAERNAGKVGTCFQGLQFCYVEDGIGDGVVWCGFLEKGKRYRGDYRTLTRRGFELEKGLLEKLLVLFGPSGRAIEKLIDVRRRGESDGLHDLKRLMTALARVIEKGELKSAQEARFPSQDQVQLLQNTAFQAHQILGAMKAQVEFADYIAAPHMLDQVDEREVDIYGLFYKFAMIFDVIAKGQDKSIEMERTGGYLNYSRVIKETFTLLPPILLDNAIKYSAADNAINVHARIDSGQIEISITSFGALISPEDQDRIWTMGGRAQYQNITKPPGSGYGLYLAKRICESSGFEIRYQGVERRLYRGTPFGDNIFTLREKKATQ